MGGVGGRHRRTPLCGLRAGLPFAFGLVLAVAGCAHDHHPPPRASGPGVVHTVRSGENLYRIALYYDVSTKAIIEANQIRDVTAIRVGTRLFVPEADRPPAKHALRPPRTKAPARARPARSGPRPAFVWPVRGQLTSRFGFRWGRLHEGIDVAAPSGTLIRAARAGRVIYSGNGLGAYGNVVIVRHAGPYETVYAHNRRNRVRRGARVEQGQVIAEVGASGNATGPHLHFEIRRNDRARDPLLYLD